MKSPVVNAHRSCGHKTSVSLEDAFWKGLKEIAGRRLMTLSNLVESIDTRASARQSFVGAPAPRAGVLSQPNPATEGREGLRELMDRPKPLLS